VEWGDAPSQDVIGPTCVRPWDLLLSPATDTDASQRRTTCVSKDIQQSDRALRRWPVCPSDGNPHHGTATLNLCTCIHLIYLTHESRQATPIRPRCRQQQVEMCPKGSYRWITPSVSACLPELCLPSGSIRISGVTAHNICIAGLCISVLYLYHSCLTRQHHPCSLTCPCIPSD
jgi:hypothetical protein